MALFKSFGKNPSAAEAEQFRLSSNYHQHGFKNLSNTAVINENASIWKSALKFFNKPANTSPVSTLPSIRTDLFDTSENNPMIVWFGHSSYFIRIAGKTILVDPVFSGYASPFNFGMKSFAGSDVYSATDFPDIDILLLTHDHYDHIDHRTILTLKPKIKQICTSLGIGSHLAYWGFDRKMIHEFDWWAQKDIQGISITAAPARHFSGRGLKRYQTLWSSFVIEADQYKIYAGADSGYDHHFKTIGERFGQFDMALLETGQYNENWPLIHMSPEEAVQAAIDLNARVVLPVHWAKFALAFHPWQEPIERVSRRAAELNVPITTPLIGEPVILDKSYPDLQWWKKVQ